MASATHILKHAELHILRDVELWKFHAPSWSQTQDTLRKLRNDLSKVGQNPTSDEHSLTLAGGSTL